MITGTRKFITKEIQQDADVYTGESGEVWFQEGTQTLRFGDDLTPGGITLVTGFTGAPTICIPGNSSVVFTASSSAIRTLKIIAQCEGYETGVIDYVDVQSSEIMAVKNFRTNTGDVSVYGITYTSVSPLVVFDAQISIDGVLEVTATPASLTNPVTIKTIAYEIEQA